MKFLTLTFLFSLFALIANAEYRASIGSGLVIEDLEIKGSKLAVIPRIDTKVPIILRIVEAKSVEGGYSYDLHVEGLDEGKYNLASYLKRADGSVEAIPEIPFEAYSILKDKWAEPRALEKVKPEKIGGYITLVLVLIVLWVVGLVAILLLKRKRATTAQVTADPTLGERIYKLLKESNNDLTADQKAELDRMVIGHWRHQFPDLEHRPVADSISFLKGNPKSAPMLLSIEKWLHSGRDVSAQEIDEALSSYQFSKQKEEPTT